MAQLKDTLVNGDLRVSGNIYGSITDASKISISSIGSNVVSPILATNTTSTGSQSVVRSTDFFVKYDPNYGTWVRIGNASTSSVTATGTLSLATGSSHYVDFLPDSSTNANITVKLPTHSGSLIAMQNSNEINMDGYGHTTNVWFNYRGSNNSADTTYKCTDYYFADRTADNNNGYTTTTLHAGKYEVAKQASLQYNSSSDAIEFKFI